MDIYSHIVNKWAKEHIGKTVDETKVLMNDKLPKFELHVIKIIDDDPQMDIALNDLIRFKTDPIYTPYMYYPQKFFNPPMENYMQVIEYKNVIVDAKIY